MSKDEVIEQFAVSIDLLLDLTDKYPHESLDVHILDSIVVIGKTCGKQSCVLHEKKLTTILSVTILPNSDPLNMDHLRSKDPEPAHPNRDPVCVTSTKIRHDNMELHNLIRKCQDLT